MRLEISHVRSNYHPLIVRRAFNESHNSLLRINGEERVVLSGKDNSKVLCDRFNKTIALHFSRLKIAENQSFAHQREQAIMLIASFKIFCFVKGSFQKYVISTFYFK